MYLYVYVHVDAYIFAHVYVHGCMLNVNVNVYVFIFVACTRDTYTYKRFEKKICTHTCVHICYAGMGWLRLVGSLKL